MTLRIVYFNYKSSFAVPKLRLPYIANKNTGHTDKC